MSILKDIVKRRPFRGYADWWNLGRVLSGFMAESIFSQWSGLPCNDGDPGIVEKYVSEYMNVVYQRKPRVSLVENFIDKIFPSPLQSGEFDALSYSFHRSAFESIEVHSEKYDTPPAREMRLFTKRVGKVFFRQLCDHLNIEIPTGLDNERAFLQLKNTLRNIGTFLKTQGYLRDYFDFKFDFENFEIMCAGERIEQTDSTFVERLKNRGVAYAIYEMGYPVVLPSAVYLYHTIGEAQHHSSRTIEELFEKMGYEAREADDFDPSAYPPDRVVELWKIRKRKG